MKILFAIIVPLLFLFRYRSKKRYPPGPKGWPLIGNLFDLPTSRIHEKLTQYAKDIGSDIIHLNVAGKAFICLSSLEACNDLMDKRSNIYSCRPQPTMVYELMNGHRLLPIQSYGSEWREGRRILARHLGGSNKQLIDGCITKFIRKGLLPNLLNTPDNFLTHIRNCVGGSVVALAYGLHIKRVDDPWIASAEKTLKTIGAASVAGKYAVDILPFLKYIPEWFPGASFHKDAREGRKLVDHFFEAPFAASKKGLADGTAQASFISKSLESLDGPNEEMEKIIENTGGMFATGGTDTNVAALENFLIVLLLFPDIQAKAQAEIDAVTRKGRLPEFEDRHKLPYLRAVLKELLRWRPIGTVCLPHLTTADDEYRGYFIPKGSLIIGNTWAIMHDENVFPEPSKFDPTRFLTPDGQLKTDINVPDPEVDATFGFGQRICPGIDLGLLSFWLGAACILACFNVTPPLDKEGRPIPQQFEWLGKETVFHPEPFKCRITPRSKEVAAIIRAEYDETSEYVQ